MRRFQLPFLDPSSRYKILWSAVKSPPRVVGSEVPSACRRGLFFASGACRLCQSAYFTIRTFWELREHIVISFWFGIAGSPCPKYAGLFVCTARVSSRVGHNRGKSCSRNRVSTSTCFDQKCFPDQHCVVVDKTFKEQFQKFEHSTSVSGTWFPLVGLCPIHGLAFC